MRVHSISRLRLRRDLARTAYCDDELQMDRAHCDLVDKCPEEADAPLNEEIVCVEGRIAARSLTSYCVVLIDDDRWSDSQEETLRRCYLAGCLFCEIIENEKESVRWCGRLVYFIAEKASELSLQTDLLAYLNRVCPQRSRPPRSSPFNKLMGKLFTAGSLDHEFRPISAAPCAVTEEPQRPSTVPPPAN